MDPSKLIRKVDIRDSEPESYRLKIALGCDFTIGDTMMYRNSMCYKRFTHLYRFRLLEVLGLQC